MNKNGTGRARQAIPPSTLVAGPTPMRRNIGRAARGNPLYFRLATVPLGRYTLTYLAIRERNIVLAETALAA
jgi:hypothetical protein